MSNNITKYIMNIMIQHNKRSIILNVDETLVHAYIHHYSYIEYVNMVSVNVTNAVGNGNGDC